MLQVDSFLPSGKGGISGLYWGNGKIKWKLLFWVNRGGTLGCIGIMEKRMETIIL